MTSPESALSILLVEDDSSLAKGLEYTFRKEGYSTTAATSYTEAQEKFYTHPFDCVILDIGLPDGNGFDLCTRIRTTSDVPIIFLTACDEEVNIVMGLDLGADDYIPKPFRVNELISRIKAVVRRKNGAEAGTGRILRSGEIILDRGSCVVRKKEKPIQLTATEYRLLHIFMSNRGQTITRGRLAELLWDREEIFIDENTVSVYIRRLREKLEDSPGHPSHIVTARGLGYRWE